MKRFKSFVIAIAVSLIGSTKPAGAGSIPLGTTGWTATWADFQNGDPMTGDIVNASFAAGTFTKTVTYRTLQPVVITFAENAIAGVDASPNTGPFRFLMDEIVKNRTMFDWSGFREELRNDTPVCDDAAKNTEDTCAVTTPGRVPPTRNIGTGAHPQFPHFHNENAMKSDKFTQLLGGGDAMSFFLVGGGVVVKGTGEWDPRGIGVHDIEVQGRLRVFTLIETPVPVPEPASLLLLSAGLVMILIRANYLRNRNILRWH